MAKTLFNLSLPTRPTRKEDSATIKKIMKPKEVEVSIKGGKSLFQQVSQMISITKSKLTHMKDKYELITDEETFSNYISDAIKNGIVAIDTETTGLDPKECEIAGVCLYTYSKKPCYVPINHVNYISNTRYDDQLSPEIVRKHLAKLIVANVKTVFFNAVFDIRVIINTLGIHFKCYWDCYVAQKMLDENDPECNLKSLYSKYCNSGEDDSFHYDELFGHNIPFTFVPPHVAYLYAAGDPYKTLVLYDFQKKYLHPDYIDKSKEDIVNLSYSFMEIECPTVNVVVNLEEAGIGLDLEYAKKLDEKYSKILEEQLAEIEQEIKCYQLDINEYINKTGINCKLNDPINIGSPIQLAILLYDIIKVQVPKKFGRGVGKEVLETMTDLKLAKLILNYRTTSKLVSTYIKKLPKNVNKKTGKIHARFNQVGADTGRFASKDPNLQNIPSKNKDIRKLFIPDPGYVLLSSDYSAQEPRITAHLSGDKKMIQSYVEGRDLYAELASIAFGVPYEECLEHREDGTVNKQGKERRSSAKAIFLGVTYSKHMQTIAEDLNVPVKKAQEIYDKVLNSSPGLKSFMEECQTMASTLGYVTTLWGRKRRLPDMLLPEFEFSYMNGFKPAELNPFDLTNEFTEVQTEVDELTVRMFTKKLKSCKYYKQKQEILQKLKEMGIEVKDNTQRIEEARRKCVNSRVQGSAAEMIKKAMILIDKNKELKELKFEMLIPIHDEILGQCPIENVGRVKELFSALMVEAAKDLCVPSKCDVEVTDRWTGTVLDL